MISFIIPAKNEENYIIDCLTSITEQETKESYEVLVVDNGSNDHTVEIVKNKFSQVNILKETASGTNTARQRGATEARGGILIFLDADVRLPKKTWLASALKSINLPEVVAVSSHYKYYGLAWHLKIFQIIGTFVFVYPWVYLFNNLFHHSAHMVGGMMIIKKDPLLKAGGFDEDSEFFGDEALITRKLYAFGKIIVSPKFWVFTSGRRFTKQSMIYIVFKYVLNYFWVLCFGKPYHYKGYEAVR